MILRALRRARAQRGGTGPGKTTVYDFLRGKTFVRGAPERRGIKAKLTPSTLRVFNKVRQQLQKRVDNQWHVTWSDILRAGTKELRKRGAWPRNKKMVSESTLAKAMRLKLGVKKMPARARIARMRGEEDRRYRHALRWATRRGLMAFGMPRVSRSGQ